jgi:hypothetical protein
MAQENRKGITPEQLKQLAKAAAEREFRAEVRKHKHRNRVNWHEYDWDADSYWDPMHNAWIDRGDKD